MCLFVGCFSRRDKFVHDINVGNCNPALDGVSLATCYQVVYILREFYCVH